MTNESIDKVASIGAEIEKLKKEISRVFDDPTGKEAFTAARSHGLNEAIRELSNTTTGYLQRRINELYEQARRIKN